ncbi:hypothetical protein OMK64_17570 [Cellulomonas fimi]|uniref:ATP-binding protein n=1 Tax=Cellulomonas fimi TaxID=1708 RepID=UPI00234DC905|nr:BTAD domain-containing putative transcriptional regulator [Cellulomonas fimi]MDC7123342.1 hypothetical protein [Cellulomonas fimi]
MPAVVASVLGPVLVAAGDRSVSPGGPRARALVVALALADGATVPWRALADELWPDDPPADPRGALQTVVSRTRAAASAQVVESQDGGYRLGGTSDLSVVRRASADARVLLARDPRAALAAVREATSLWRGTAGPDVADAALGLADALADAARSARDALAAVEVEALLALGRPEEALDLAATAAGSAPADEDAQLRLMRVQAAAGRTTDALRTFARLRDVLADELGADPRADLVALNEQLLAGAVDASLGTSAAVPPPAGDGGRSSSRRVPARHPVGLRAPRHALLGRADDLAAVDAAWADARLVTVLGTGGLGKTTLAQEVGRRAQDDAWVVVVELAGVRSDVDVETAIASALGLAHGARSARLGDRLPPTPDATGRIAERLGEVPTLLVLDNCEHVVAGAAQCADALLAAVPGLRVLTTSRTPLLVAGERVHPLAPLPVDGGHGAAVELFRERARAARPGVALPVDVVARIATRLDGLPLAIELAAARVRTMTVEEVERRLVARFALLRSGDRLAPDRHRTLEAVIDWSWHLLDDDQQRVLRRLSLLPDGFDLDAAATLGRLATATAVTDDGVGTDDDWDVLDALDGLVLQSLCSVVEDRGEGDDEPVVRYRMLETVREFGQLRLTEAGEHDAALDAMLAWALAFAARWSPALVDGDQPAAMRALRREQDNLLLAFRTALDRGLSGEAYTLYVALTGYWSLRGAHEQVFGLGLDLLAGTHGWRVEPRHADATALALTELAAMGIFGDAGSTARALARLRLVVRELGSQLGPRTRAFAGLALAGSVAGMARELADLRRSTDTYLAMMGHMLSAQLAENSGRLEVARRWIEEAYVLGVARGDVWAEANNASFLAQLAAEEGLAQEALRWVSVARTGMGRLVAEEELHQVAWLELAASVGAGDLATARDRCDALAEVAASGRTGRTTWQSSELAALEQAGRGEIAAAEGDVGAALDHLRTAYDAFGPDGGGERTSPWFIMITVGWIARLVLAPEAAREGRPAPSAPAPALARHVHEWQLVRAADAVDHPVLGTAAVGLGTAAWAVVDGGSRVDDGLELFFLAELLGSRQDLPMLHRAPLEARARELLGSDRVDAARARARAVGRRHAAARALALVDALWR